MEELLLFIEEKQTWIYLLLALAGVVYLRSIFYSYREIRRAIFNLERERATSKMVRSGAMLALIVAGLVATFVIATFASPALLASTLQTPLPTVSLLTTPMSDVNATQGNPTTATSLDQMPVDSSGCLNPDATITSPVDGETVSGVVQIFGTANIQYFAFYKIEYRSEALDSVWQAVSAGTEPVCEVGCGEADLLGTWDTSLVTPGWYEFRLVVTDTEGNAPLPCAIRLRVFPSP
jgi:hypothetical protein